jgi:hypothetical protein
MARKKPVLGLALDRTEDGRLARLAVPNPTQLGSNRLGRRDLPKIPLVASVKIRHTAAPRRGSR